MVIAAAGLLNIFKIIVPRNTNKNVQHFNIINKLTSTLLGYQTPQSVVTQNVQAQRVAMASTDPHVRTSHKVIHTAPQINRQQTRRNNPFEEIEEEI